jgi:recombination protein RecA
MAVAALHRRFGPQVLVKGLAARRDGRAAVPHIPTGFPDLDRVLGIGGLPKGKVCEVAGPATSGKTTLAIKFLTQAQAGGQVGAPPTSQVAAPPTNQVAYIDQALYFDPDYAHRCGLDLSRLIVGQPADTEEALAMTEALTRSGQLAALVFDALDFFWTDPAIASRLAATLNRLPAPLARSGTILLVLHEAPDSGSPALSALAHSAAVRLRVVREGWLRRQGDVRGYKARVEVLKNRLGPTGRTASIRIEFNGTVRGNGL